MIYSVSNFGYEGRLVTVECDVREGIPSLDIVGLADSSVKELRERVKVAMKNSCNVEIDKRVLLSLSPADLKKEGACFDLPVALAIITALKGQETEKVVAFGELELSGKVRAVRGVYNALLCAKENGIDMAIIPKGNENDIPEGIKYAVVEDLQEALDYTLNQKVLMTKVEKEVEMSTGVDDYSSIFSKVDDDVSLDNVKDFASAKFAMAVAAAGKLNLLFYGSPGCGKTMLLQRFGQLLPLMNKEEMEVVKRIRSLVGFPNDEDNRRPFRMPHQSASIEGMCGGGIRCSPGEISLAHNGVLFLDEAAEFRSSVLQMLRVPLESKQITLSRAGRNTVYPANFQLLMAVNPCPCGNFGVEGKICLCSATSVKTYWNKFSAPLLDRVQIKVKIEKECIDFSLGTLRKMVYLAFVVAQERGGFVSELPITDKCFNANWELVKDYNGRKLDNIKRIARTIADMYGQEKIEESDIKHAIELCGEIPLENI